MTDIITHELLKSWSPCIAGYKRFCELFPKGADLETAVEGLVADGHDNWGLWLFNKCREENLFSEFTSQGYRNSGDRNSGDCNSGYRNSGDCNSGDRNSGDRNSGGRNSGDRNSGYRNSGDRNSGYKNSGYRNSGDCNSGDWNSGDRNSGYKNSGDRNSGDCNSGDWNSGFFNSVTPDEILVFNKTCKRSVWDASVKPSFLYRIEITYWVPESEMSEEDKVTDPNFFVRGGQLRERDYKEAWALAYNNATEEDKALLKALPNFDADVFFEITGIRV